MGAGKLRTEPRDEGMLRFALCLRAKRFVKRRRLSFSPLLVPNEFPNDGKEPIVGKIVNHRGTCVQRYIVRHNHVCVRNLNVDSHGKQHEYTGSH